MTLDPANGFPTTDPTIGTWAGDVNQQALQFVLDIDTAMRTNYAINIENVGQRVFPMMYVESTFDGGRYTLLVDDDTRYVKQNVSPVYDMCKAIAHIPLGIYSIIGGYFDEPGKGQWIAPLAAYRAQVALVADNFDKLSTFDSGPPYDCAPILSATIQWMDDAINKQTFTLASYVSMCRFLTGRIVACQRVAATIQINQMSAALNEWKAMIGDDQWSKLYVVISALWTLTQENAHEMIIKATMSTAQQETNVIVSEAPQSLHDAQNLLGRILGDRVMAGYVFNNQGTHDEKENIYSLSTQRDLLSQAVEQALAGGPGGIAGNAENAASAGGVSAAAMCPYLAR